MTRDEARSILRQQEIRELVRKLAERFTDNALGPEPPGRLYCEVDSRCIEAIEEALEMVALDVPSSVREWEDERRMDHLAERAKQGSYGL